MIKRNGSYPIDRIEKMRDGDGVVVIEHLLTTGEMYEKGRLFAVITLAPGDSVGFHTHEGEMESYYVMCGEAEYSDGAETTTLRPGDSTLTLSGEGHSVKCVGDETLKLLALILFK